MGVTFYYSSVTGNLEMKKQQQKIDMILEAKKIDFQKIDIAASDEAKARMRAIMGNPSGLPPQLSNGDQYCGDFTAFEEALEDESLEEFLKLK